MPPPTYIGVGVPDLAFNFLSIQGEKFTKLFFNVSCAIDTVCPKDSITFFRLSLTKFGFFLDAPRFDRDRGNRVASANRKICLF